MHQRQFVKWAVALLCVVIGVTMWLLNRGQESSAEVSPLLRSATEGAATSLAVPTVPSERVPASAAAPAPTVPPSVKESAAVGTSFWGQLIASTDSLPIQGARISGLDEAEIGARASDAEGRFNFLSESKPAPILRVDAAGFALVLVELVPGHESIEQAMTIPLQRAATLEARLIDRNGAPLAGRVVKLSSPAHALARPEGSYLFHAPLSWSETTDDAGTCTLTDLPPEVALSLSVFDAGRVEFLEANPLTLQPGELRRWEHRLGGGVRLFGVAIDQDRAAVGGLQLWLAGKDATLGARADQHYFRASLADFVVQRATTDSAGRFSFADVQSGEWLLGPAPTATAVTAPVAEIVLIDALGPDRELNLNVHAGLHVRGRVLQPDGKSAGRTTVYAVCDEPSGVMSAQSQSDGQFSLGPFAPGALRLMASGTRGLADSEYVRAQAGSEELVLQLRQAARLQVFAVDAATGAPVLARFYLQARPPVQSRQIREMLDPSRVALGLEIDGLLEGIYDISALTPDGRIGVAREVRVGSGAPSAPATLRVAPAAKLRVRLQGNTPPCTLEVESEGRFLWCFDSIRPGANQLVHVPGGTLNVRLKFREQVLEQREVFATIDQVAEVEFQRD